MSVPSQIYGSLSHRVVSCSCDFDCSKRVERFFDFIEVDEAGCWIWTGSRRGAGRHWYGKFHAGYLGGWRGKRVIAVAHRWSYEHFVGPIAAGLVADHLCRVTLCVNPFHVEPVTVRQNTLRGDTLAAENAALTHCRKGHEFTPGNTKAPPSRGRRRHCRVCWNTKNRKRAAAKRAAVA